MIRPSLIDRLLCRLLGHTRPTWHPLVIYLDGGTLQTGTCRRCWKRLGERRI